VLDPAFADDLTLVTNTPQGNQFLLDKLHSFLQWSQTLRLKVPKCLALAFGCFDRCNPTAWGMYDPHLKVGGQAIAVMGPDGCKYLGRRMDPSLSEDRVREFIVASVLEWMRLIDGTQLLGIMKCWIYNVFVISKLSWLFTIHDLSLSFVKTKVHPLVLPFLKRWCGIPKGGNTAILFCGPPDCMGLALKPVYTIYKACQVIRRDILQRSSDPSVRLLFELELTKQLAWTGPRFAAARELLGVQALATDVEVRSHRQGLGFKSSPRRSLSRSSAYKYFQSLDSEALLSHADSLAMQGKIRLLDSLALGDWSWERLLYGYADGLFRFKVDSTNNSLPTGDNLRRWTAEHLAPRCSACSCSCPTLKHVLNGCSAFLFQGRYKWRHDAVLKVIFDSISRFLSSRRSDEGSLPYISFVPQGQGNSGSRRHQGPVGRRQLAVGLLGGIHDWVLMGDGVSENYSVPLELAITSLRPDILLFSFSSKSCILLELTVPFEDGVCAAADRKSQKYQALQQEIASNGYTCTLFTVEVGCRGNSIDSLRLCLSKLGLGRKVVNRVCQSAALTALRCSYYIYLSRSNPSWQLR
jgi:hypothetical protein